MKTTINRNPLTPVTIILFLSFLSQYSFAQNKMEDATTAQDYKKFKLGFGFGPAIFGGATNDQNYHKSGLILTLEPAYRASNSLAIGLRIEEVLHYWGSNLIDGHDMSFASFTLNGQYYLSTDKFKPFVGAGLGMYIFSYRSETHIGFYPRIGFELWHLSVSMDYNLIPGLIPEIEFAKVDKGTNHYLGIRIGFFVGGGKK